MFEKFLNGLGEVKRMDDIFLCGKENIKKKLTHAMIDAMQKIEQLLGACFGGLRLALHALVARRKLLCQVGAVAGGAMFAHGYPWIHNILFREHNSAANIFQTSSSSAWARIKRDAMFVLGNPGKMADSTDFMTNYRGISAKLKKYDMHMP